MACQDYEILINKAIDRQLSMEGCRELAAHLNACPSCAALYYEYKALDDALKQNMADVEVPAHFKADIMAALPRKKAQPRRLRPRGIISIAGLGAIAAALVLAAGVGGWFSTEDGVIPPIDELPIADIDPVGDDDPLQSAQNGEDIIEPGNIDQVPAGNDEQPDDQTSAPGDDVQQSPGEDTITYSGGIMLPKVASGSTQHGSYSLYTLASHAEHDALVPSVSGNTVSYYIVEDGYYLQWETYLDRSAEPVYVGENTSMPAPSHVGGYNDNSGEYGYTYVSDNSAEGMYQAINRAGDTPGLYIINNASGTEPVLVDALGGGSIVSWAPDGNKVLYTRADGSLHLYYPDQQLILDIYSGITSCVSWAADSRNIVFSAADSATGHMSVFSVIVP